MIWQDRTRTDPTKRKFIDENGNEQNVNIEEIQSNITQSGTPVNATTMNNIEKNLGTYGNDTYDSTATYSIGDVVTHNALLYRAKQDIDTAEEWTAAHWEETSALDELKKTSGNEVLISDDEGDITYQTKIFVDSDTGTAKYRDTNDSFVPLKDNEVIISDTEPTSADNEIWVDTSSNATYINQEVNIGATNPSNIRTWFKQSKNLFNKDIAMDGFITNASNQNDSWYYTPITNWNVGDTLVTSGGRAIISFFNGATNISYSDITNTTITIPANTTIVYVSTLKSNTQFQIEIGSTASEYEPYAITSIVLNSNNEIYRKPHKEILWSGDGTDANTELPLSESYTSFEKVGICYGPHNTNHKLYMEFYTEDLPNGADIDLFGMQTPSIYASCDLKPTNNKKFTINSTANQTWGKIHITKIYGINRIV